MPARGRAPSTLSEEPAMPSDWIDELYEPWYKKYLWPDADNLIPPITDRSGAFPPIGFPSADTNGPSPWPLLEPSVTGALQGWPDMAGVGTPPYLPTPPATPGMPNAFPYPVGTSGSDAPTVTEMADAILKSRTSPLGQSWYPTATINTPTSPQGPAPSGASSTFDATLPIDNANPEAVDSFLPNLSSSAPPDSERHVRQGILSYPEVYAKINREARDQMWSGIKQSGEALGERSDDPKERGASALKFAGGITNTLFGGANYAASPISAALRTIVGNPLEANFGIPREYTEFATALALPWLRLPKGPAGIRQATGQFTEMYPAPTKPQRPFSEDYPNGATADASGRLTRDMDGRP
jgi:hypothetical protein